MTGEVQSDPNAAPSNTTPQPLLPVTGEEQSEPNATFSNTTNAPVVSQNIADDQVDSIEHVSTSGNDSQCQSSSDVAPPKTGTETSSDPQLAQQKFTNEFNVTFSREDFVVIGLAKRYVVAKIKHVHPDEKYIDFNYYTICNDGRLADQSKTEKHTPDAVIMCLGPKKTMKLTKLQREKVEQTYKDIFSY